MRSRSDYEILACAGALVVALGALAPQPAAAEATCTKLSGDSNETADGSCPGAKWPNGQFSFLVDTASFSNNRLDGLSLTTDEVRYWVNASLSVWKERTGIQDGLQFNYGTYSTSGPAACDQLTHVFNGTNNVYASSYCHPNDPAPCQFLGSARRKCDGTCSNWIESDVCIWGAAVGTAGDSCAGKWSVRFEELANAGTADLAFVLTHELGHALGLGHNTVAGTVMRGGGCGGLNDMRRVPFGDEIRGLRKVYPASTTDVARWRQMTSASWGSAVSVSSIDGPWGVQAAVGKRGSGEAVIVTELSDGGSTIGFNRATYPISSSSSWSASFATINTWRPPAIAARPLGDPAGELWVAAVAREVVLPSDCPGVRVYSSSNGFVNRTAVDLTEVCQTLHEPTLTYDRASGRFIMFLVSRAGGQLITRTSTDGVTWTTPYFVNVNSAYLRTGDAVDAACAATASECMMTYVSDAKLPVPTTRRFTVTGSFPYMQLAGSTGAASTIADRTPAAGVRTRNSANEWLIGVPTAAGSGTNRANGVHYVLTAPSTSNPFSSFSFTQIGSELDSHRPAFASAPGSGRVYLWYVR